MFKFLSLLQITPRFKTQIKVISISLTGFTLGYAKGYIVNQKYENVNDQKLTKYENEDQINMLIQQSKKPAIIYYYFSNVMEHYFFRQMMFKYSNLYPQNCIWVMVNVRKNFQQMKSSLDLQYPTRVRIEARYPKSDIALKVKDNFIEMKGHRRQGYQFNYNEQGFKKFLQHSKIIKGIDPIQNLLNVTKKTLFNPIQ